MAMDSKRNYALFSGLELLEQKGQNATWLSEFDLMTESLLTPMEGNKYLLRSVIYEGPNLKRLPVSPMKEYLFFNRSIMRDAKAEQLFEQRRADAYSILIKTEEQVYLRRASMRIREVQHREDHLLGELCIATILSDIFKRFKDITADPASEPRNFYAPTVSVNDRKKVDEFLELVSWHAMSQKKLSFYSNLLFVSDQTLNAVTQKVLGKRPKQLIDEHLLESAKTLLKYSRQSIQEIAMLLGFSSSTQFAAFFKRCEKKSPSEFRWEGDPIITEPGTVERSMTGATHGER
ncbi:helix-turn-helix domain-containing protein [Sphingobacterium suaedae]|uniref:Helix-turn-helix domain-containing protein n=1 Tax=Sphingobacterium suaedae TaxID=1686402 RepID=A0ABW5KKT9_9SPHI